MASSSLPQSVSIHGTSAIDRGQSFAGINLGTINYAYAGSDNRSDANKQAVIECRQALFITDPLTDRESVISAKGTRVEGTCEWITNDAKYRAWLNGDGDGSDNDNTRLLWISGGPGKGKTMLSVFLTEEMETYTARTDNAELVFFFCSGGDEKRNTAVAVLRGLLHQIIAKRPQLVKHALPYFETRERTQQTLSSLEALWLIFSELVADAELGTMFCVLDGLDECEESTLRLLLPRLVDLLTGGSPSLTKSMFKLVIVSRDMPDLQGCIEIRLDHDNNEKVVSDIDLFVSARLAKLSRMEGFNEDFRASVQSALLQRAEGTFLWVGFVMHELSQKQTCSEILGALGDLPSGLPGIYSRMLLRIPPERREVSAAILRWVTLAVRPLRLQELAAATGIRANSPLMTVEQAARDVVSLCGPLLKVQQQEVSLVHQSARDYLLFGEHNGDPVLEAFRLDSESTHLELARKCLECIAQSDLHYRAIDQLGPSESPLLQYAILHWPEHAKSCSALAAKLFDPYGLFLQNKSSLRIHWRDTYNRMSEKYTRTPLPLLHMACFLEIIPWIEAILPKRSWRLKRYRRVNRKDAKGETALHLAIWQRNDAIVRLLLDRGANPNAKDAKGNTALHLAIGRKDDAIVRLLLDRGANPDAKDEFGETPLVSALRYYGYEKSVRLLVNKGADLEARQWTLGRKALHIAAGIGDKALVQLLVEKGADIKAKTSSGQTALHYAAAGRHEAVVQLLVDLGADIRVKDRDGTTVLHNAAGGGSKEVVQLLVDLGADTKAESMFGMTALHFAAKGGNEEIVQLLIDLGADIKAKDMMGRTALDLAFSRKVNKAVVRLLVDHGARRKGRGLV